MDKTSSFPKEAANPKLQQDQQEEIVGRRGRIVVGIDGSESSVSALRYASNLATALDASLEAISVWAYPPFFATDPPANWWPEEEAQRTLAEASAAVFGDGVPPWFQTTVKRGTPARVLIDESDHADMLILGARGHGGFVGLLLGSVSTTCAQHAHCPVLIMHQARTAEVTP